MSESWFMLLPPSPYRLPTVDVSDPEFGLYDLCFSLHNTRSEITSVHFYRLSSHKGNLITGISRGNSDHLFRVCLLLLLAKLSEIMSRIILRLVLNGLGPGTQDGLVRLTAIGRNDLQRHRPLSGTVTLPWKNGTLGGSVEVHMSRATTMSFFNIYS